MKNILLVSFVAISGIVGGAYFFLTPDKINSFVGYLPEPIAGLITTDTSENNQNSDTAKTIEQSQNQEHVVENMPAFKTQEVEVEVKENKTAGIVQEEISMEKTTADTSEVMPEVSNDNQLTTESIASQASTETTQKTKITTKEKPSVEVLELESQIQDIEKSIGQLDGENTVLKERFQTILKENRALALKLRKIDKQIKISSE